MSLPLLDVTEVLDDPHFLDTTAQLVRSTETVGAHGRSTVVEAAPVPLRAVVTVDPASLRRLPDGTRAQMAIMVWTRTELVSVQTGRPADSVLWRGRRYQVMSVSDWSTYGQGFYSASCDLVGLASGPVVP